MGTISLTDVTPNTEIQSSPINNNNAILEGEINGGLEDVNFATNADLAVSKLANGSDGQFLKTVGTTPTWAALPTTTFPVRLLDQTGTLIDVVSTVADTVIYTKSVPGNSLGANGVMRLTLVCDYLNDSGTGRTFDLRVKWGGTTFYLDSSPAIAISGTRAAVRIEIIVANLNATNAQAIDGHFYMSIRGNASTGTGNLASTGDLMNAHFGNEAVPAIDTTAAATLELSVQHSASHASLSFRRKYGVLELLTV